MLVDYEQLDTVGWHAGNTALAPRLSAAGLIFSCHGSARLTPPVGRCTDELGTWKSAKSSGAAPSGRDGDLR
jgi:hypothetical protein